MNTLLTTENSQQKNKSAKLTSKELSRQHNNDISNVYSNIKKSIRISGVMERARRKYSQDQKDIEKALEI